MPESPRRKKTARKPDSTKPKTPEQLALEPEETPRDRGLVQRIGALIIVLLIVGSMVVGVLLPFFVH